MPNDREGNEVKVGDPVQLTGRVLRVDQNIDGCNCQISIDAPEHEFHPVLLLNTRSLVLADDEPITNHGGQHAAARGA